MATVTDDFAGSGSLSGNWSGAFGNSVNANRSSGELAPTGGAIGIRWNANNFTGDMYCEVTVKTLAPNGEWTPGPVCCYEESGGISAYRCCFDADTIRFVRWEEGGSSVDTESLTIATNDVIRMEVTQSGADKIVRIYQNGVQRYSFTDTSPLSGTQAGLWSYYTDALTTRVDDFGAGDLETAPTAPSGVGSSGVGATSATATWTDNSANETGFKVEYSPAPHSSWTSAPASPAAANATSLSVTGLTPGTTYKFRVAATNGAGDSSYATQAGDFTTSTGTAGRALLLGVG